MEPILMIQSHDFIETISKDIFLLVKYKLIHRFYSLIISNQSLLQSFSLVYQKLLKTLFMDIYSPFEDDLKHCKTSMRKLRKKIYKYSISHKSQQKPKDSIHGIIDRLKDRQVPEFLLNSLKKRRNFQLISIKNINICDGIPIGEISSMRSIQEQQIQKIFYEHKQRMKEVNGKKMVTVNHNKYRVQNFMKLEKRETTYSSTQEQQSDYENSQSMADISHPYFETQSHEMINSVAYRHAEQHQDISDMHDSNQQNNLYLQRNDREIYNEDLWMRFDGGIDCLLNCD